GRHHHHPGRPDARRIEVRLLRGQQFAGRRQQGYVGPGQRLDVSDANTRIPVADSGKHDAGAGSRQIRWRWRGAIGKGRSMMLCRDAESCYWIGRYVERAEAMARMVDVHFHAGLETYLPTA